MRDAQDPDVLEVEADVDLPRSPSSPVKALGLSIPVALAIIIGDQVTKRWALNSLIPGSCDQPDACIDLVAGAKFHLIFNTGAAFTQGSGLGPMFGVLAFFMSGFLLFLSSRRTDRLGIGLFGAIAGGAVGNLVDRIYRAEDGFLSGAVVDFVDLGWWPVFNVADAAIVIGVIGVIILSLFEETPESE